MINTYFKNGDRLNQLWTALRINRLKAHMLMAYQEHSPDSRYKRVPRQKSNKYICFKISHILFSFFQVIFSCFPLYLF